MILRLRIQLRIELTLGLQRLELDKPAEYSTPLTFNLIDDEGMIVDTTQHKINQGQTQLDLRIAKSLNFHIFKAGTGEMFCPFSIDFISGFMTAVGVPVPLPQIQDHFEHYGQRAFTRPISQSVRFSGGELSYRIGVLDQNQEHTPVAMKKRTSKSSTFTIPKHIQTSLLYQQSMESAARDSSISGNKGVVTWIDSSKIEQNFKDYSERRYSKQELQSRIRRPIRHYSSFERRMTLNQDMEEGFVLSYRAKMFIMLFILGLVALAGLWLNSRDDPEPVKKPGRKKKGRSSRTRY